MTAQQPSPFRRLSVLPLLLMAALGAASCGSSSGSSNAGVDLLIQDAPVDDLLSVEGTVTELYLVSDTDAETANLLSEPTELEFLGLQTQFAWLSSADIPAGTYTSVRVVFDADSIAARDLDGDDVEITELASEYTSLLTTPLVVVAGDYARLLIDIDLRESLEGDVSTPPLTFEPRGFTEVDDLDGEDAELDEFLGLVAGTSASGSYIDVKAYTDNGLANLIGTIRVFVDEETVLVREDGVEYTTPAEFFQAMVKNLTLVEIEGALNDTGDVVATGIEVEDHEGGEISSTEVKLEGSVVFVEPSGMLFAIEHVDKGGDIVETLLAGNSNEAVIEIGFDDATTFFIDGVGTTDVTSLAPGQDVEVRFDVFASPFVASRVEIEDTDSEFKAFIVGVDGLPDSILVVLGDYGSEIDAQTSGLGQIFLEYEVDLTSTEIYLDLHGDPVLEADDLVEFVDVVVRGAFVVDTVLPLLSGEIAPPVESLDVFDATSLRVLPSEMIAGVADFNAETSTFAANVEELDDFFGETAAFTTMTINVREDAFVHGDAESVEQLFELLAEAELAEADVFVEVKGLVSRDEIPEMTGYEIEIEVDMPEPEIQGGDEL